MPLPVLHHAISASAAAAAAAAAAVLSTRLTSTDVIRQTRVNSCDGLLTQSDMPSWVSGRPYTVQNIRVGKPALLSFAETPLLRFFGFVVHLL